MMITCNVVEEAFYAQDRPKILKIVPIATNQTDFNAYNYIQFDDEDIIPVKLDRIDEVKITIMTRKGDLMNFVDHHDVKCQLEFKQMEKNCFFFNFLVSVSCFQFNMCYSYKYKCILLILFVMILMK